MDSNKKINIVIFAETQDSASELANKFGTKHSEYDVWNGSTNGAATKVYTRWPNCLTTASPVGITDILIAHVSGTDSANWEAVRKYVDQRRGIPQKYLVSESDLSTQAKELQADWMASSNLEGNFGKIVSSALALDQTLKSVFDKIDIDGDGYLVNDEIIKASAELGHLLNNEDADEIVKSLSSEGKVSFDKFKQWFVFGRSNFQSFRKLVALEMKVNNFLKTEQGSALTSLFDKLKQETDDAAIHSALETRLNITPEKEFNTGTALRVHLNVGNSFNDIYNNQPEHIRNSPICVGLEIALKNADEAPKLIELLVQLKEMAAGTIPAVEQYLDKEIFVNFRQVGSSVFLDVTYSGSAVEYFYAIFSFFDVSSVSFRGQSDIHLCTEISPFDFANQEFELLFKKLFNWKIQGHGDFTQLKNLVAFFTEALPQFINLTQIMGSKEVKAIIAAIKILTSVRNVNFKFCYDSNELAHLIREVLGESFEPLGYQFTEKYQGPLQGMLEQVKAMGAMFLSPFASQLLAIDLDNIGVYVSSPLIRTHLKIGLNVRGMNDFVENILS